MLSFQYYNRWNCIHSRLGEACSHAAAVSFTVEMEKSNVLAATDKLCQWVKPPKKNVYVIRYFISQCFNDTCMFAIIFYFLKVPVEPAMTMPYFRHSNKATVDKVIKWKFSKSYHSNRRALQEGFKRDDFIAQLCQVGLFMLIKDALSTQTYLFKNVVQCTCIFPQMKFNRHVLASHFVKKIVTRVHL